jgi:hypothetical protein
MLISLHTKRSSETLQQAARLPAAASTAAAAAGLLLLQRLQQQLQLCLWPTWMDEKVFGTARRVS